MFAEAIPGVVIQLFAIMSGGHSSNAMTISLAASAIFAGFTSASISYDNDSGKYKMQAT